MLCTSICTEVTVCKVLATAAGQQDSWLRPPVDPNTYLIQAFPLSMHGRHFLSLVTVFYCWLHIVSRLQGPLQ